MNVLRLNNSPLLAALFTLVFTGCDQMGSVASGVGGATKNLADKITGGGDKKEDAEDGVATTTEVPEVDNAIVINGDDSDSDDEDPEKEDSSAEEDDDSRDDSDSDDNDDSSGDDRNIEQYARLPRNVTWKPISASSGDNLTVILWGRGGGERNYEEGTLRVEHNDGVKYPRAHVRWDDPNNHERAPKFLFDVQGSWFKGKDPVLKWNLGAYRVLYPEKRQGKNEEQ